jgi:hypothetical protein
MNSVGILLRSTVLPRRYGSPVGQVNFGILIAQPYLI